MKFSGEKLNGPQEDSQLRQTAGNYETQGLSPEKQRK